MIESDYGISEYIVIPELSFCFVAEPQRLQEYPKHSNLVEKSLFHFNSQANVKAPNIICNVLSCSLLKKVTKEHLKDDFDSLFKHLSSNQKSVTIHQMTVVSLPFFPFMSFILFDCTVRLSRLTYYSLLKLVLLRHLRMT